MPLSLLGVRSQGGRAGPQRSSPATVAGAAVEGRRWRAGGRRRLRRTSWVRDGRRVGVAASGRSAVVNTGGEDMSARKLASLGFVALMTVGPVALHAQNTPSYAPVTEQRLLNP